MNGGNSLSQEARDKNPRECAQDFWWRVLADIRKTYVDATRTESYGMTQTGIGIETHINRRDSSVPAQVAEGVGKDFCSCFTHSMLCEIWFGRQVCITGTESKVVESDRVVLRETRFLIQRVQS